MLPSKNNRAAGEIEWARPASSWIIAIKNAGVIRLFDEHSEIFCGV